MDADNMNPPAAGQRMLFWLSEAALAARETSGENQAMIAGLAHCDTRTVKRFENGEHWPRELEDMLNAYTEVAGLDNAQRLWQLALDLWYEHGAAPMISRRQDGQRDRATADQKKIIERIRQQAQRAHAANRDAPARTSTAKKTRKAANG